MNKEDDTVFTCWKEVAGYLGKGIRTVQRWEKHAGLPVQRPNARDKGIIRVSRKELDRWLDRRQPVGANVANQRETERAQNRPAPEDLVTAHDLRRANRHLLGEFKDSLRVLFAQCCQLQATLKDIREQKDTNQSTA